jgi:hypothetical protein
VPHPPSRSADNDPRGPAGVGRQSAGSRAGVREASAGSGTASRSPRPFIVPAPPSPPNPPPLHVHVVGPVHHHLTYRLFGPQLQRYGSERPHRIDDLLGRDRREVRRSPFESFPLRTGATGEPTNVPSHRGRCPHPETIGAGRNRRTRTNRPRATRVTPHEIGDLHDRGVAWDILFELGASSAPFTHAVRLAAPTICGDAARSSSSDRRRPSPRYTRTAGDLQSLPSWRLG